MPVTDPPTEDLNVTPSSTADESESVGCTGTTEPGHKLTSPLRASRVGAEVSSSCELVHANGDSNNAHAMVARTTTHDVSGETLLRRIVHSLRCMNRTSATASSLCKVRTRVPSAGECGRPAPFDAGRVDARAVLGRAA